MKPFPVLMCAIFVLSVIPLASASSVDVRARVLHDKDGLWQVTDKGNDVKVGEILSHIEKKSGGKGNDVNVEGIEIAVEKIERSAKAAKNEQFRHNIVMSLIQKMPDGRF